MERKSHTKELLKINLLTTVFVVMGNLAIFFGFDANSSTYTVLNTYFAFSILFAYFYLLLSFTRKNPLQLKNECLYINYPLNILIFFLIIFGILIGSMICLLMVNPEAANTTAIFTFFLTTISMLMPSIVLMVIVYFISPALIIPNLKTDKHNQENYKNLFFILMTIYIGVCLLKGFFSYNLMGTGQDKYKCSKLTIRFSTESLKIAENVKPYAKKLMSRDKLEIPFFYTTESFSFEKYDDAEVFCKVMNARVPNYLEMYHIAFNYFDTFGDKYYWTSDKDEKVPLVLHFKNMSYTIERLPANIKPSLYCVASAEDNYGFKNKEYFYRNSVIEKTEVEKSLKSVQTNSFKDLDDLLEQETDTRLLQQQDYSGTGINSDKKHVNFSVKEVTPDIMQMLMRKGYHYNPTIKIKPEFETNDAQFSAAINRDAKNIKLCYYPFTEYGDMTIEQERQIWEQSFCSPSFTVINPIPSYIAKSNRNTYCQNFGGRLPNVPELAAILKVTGADAVGTKYWTGSNVVDEGRYTPIAAYYSDSRFMTLEPIRAEMSAFAYCIRPTNPPSKVIANYRSKFKGYEGQPLASKYCSDCHYYEVPDVIVRP